jgi:hypothetical protein
MIEILRARSSVDRAVDFESKGRGFKSLRARFLFPHINQRLPRASGGRVRAKYGRFN